MGDLGEDQLSGGGGESEDEDGDDDPPPDHLLVAKLPPLLDQVVLEDGGGHSSPLLSAHRVLSQVVNKDTVQTSTGEHLLVRARGPKLVPVMGTQLVLKSTRSRAGTSVHTGEPNLSLWSPHTAAAHGTFSQLVHRRQGHSSVVTGRAPAKSLGSVHQCAAERTRSANRADS